MVPIFSHRFVVCGPNPESSVVLSIVTDITDDVDAIVYAGSLEEYLVREFLSDDDIALVKRAARVLQSAFQRRTQRRAPVRPRRRR
jgi:hypothetical protein